jgi:acyl dehydratase
MTTIAWFDDLAVGMRFKSGEAQITAPEIKRFAAEFDPQPMHPDEEAAGKTFFKGLAASGWHTASIAMRLLVESRPFGDHPIIGIGGGVRWLAPVRPGDVLRPEGEVESGRFGDPLATAELGDVLLAAQSFQHDTHLRRRRRDPRLRPQRSPSDHRASPPGRGAICQAAGASPPIPTKLSPQSNAGTSVWFDLQAQETPSTIKGTLTVRSSR